MPAAPDGGVVHQHVQLAIGRNRGRDGLLPVILAGNVEVNIGGIAAQFVYLRGHGHSVGIQHVGNDHLRSLAGKEPGFRRALTAGSAGNQRNLSFQSHSFPRLHF